MKKTLTTLTLALGLSAAASAQTDGFHQFGALDYGTITGSTSEVIIALSDFASGTTTLSGIAGEVGGQAFTYDVVFTDASTNGGRLGGPSGAANIDADFDVTITNISNVNVEFAGFHGIQTANHANAADSGLLISGTTYTAATGSKNGVDLVGGPLDPALGFQWVAGTSNDNLRIASLQWEFTAVPEPSSYALLAGLLGLGYVMVRRRK